MSEINRVYAVGAAHGTWAYIWRRELSPTGDVAPGKLVTKGDQLGAVVLDLRARQVNGVQPQSYLARSLERVYPGNFKRTA